MTEGELLQLTLLGHADISEGQYLDVLKRKTAYLFSASCEIGAILGGASEKQKTALREYGLNLGTAFQLTDDLLDFTSSNAAMGKAAGADLLDGKVTLPLIYLMTADAKAASMVQRVLLDASYDTVSQEDLRGALDHAGALEQARAMADQYAENARSAVDDLPDSEYADSLRALPTYVLKRDR